MRNEILSLVERLLAENKFVSPVFDIGGAGTQYQKEQGYNFRRMFHEKNIEYYIVDIVNSEGVDYNIDAKYFNVPKNRRPASILCTEMLEHCSDPVGIINNCYRILKAENIIVVTAPDIYRVHCAKDFWRFTENGLKELCKNFEMLEFGGMGSEEKHNLEYFFIGKKVKKHTFMRTDEEINKKDDTNGN